VLSLVCYLALLKSNSRLTRYCEIAQCSRYLPSLFMPRAWSDDSHYYCCVFFTDTSLLARFQSEIPDSSDRPRLLYFWILNGIGPKLRWLEWVGQARHSVSTVASCTNAQSLSSIDSLSRVMLAHMLFRTENFVRPR
jgi:hypothetical protein